MNQKNIFILIFFVSTFFSCDEQISLEDLKSFAATEIYPDDLFLDTVSNKKALIIVAHDDDDCAMSGTIAKLTEDGWVIKQLSFKQHIITDQGVNPAHIICQGNEPIIGDELYRIGLDTMKIPWVPIPYEEIDDQFLSEKVAHALVDKVNKFNPSVIFTLDDVKGGYGHPEHIFISKLVLKLFENRELNNERIYQSVYTDNMEREIVDTWLKAKMEKSGYPHASTIANELYSIDGMPEPTVQINIEDQAVTKMVYLRAYPENVKKNLRKFIPYYEEFDAQTYFSVFNKEFFRVLQR
mgnify:CR=1 FL=1